MNKQDTLRPAPPKPRVRDFDVRTGRPLTQTINLRGVRRIAEPVIERMPEPMIAHPKKSASAWKQIGAWLQYPVIAAAALGAAYSSTIGQWLVLSFVIIAIITKRRSQLTFGTSLFLLVTLPLFQAIGQSGIMQNVAIYVYELLVFGVGQAIFESRKS
jgi:hypothetical protein